MQDIQREFRDSGLITNTKICFEVRATALRPHLHTERFSLFVHTGLPTQGTSTEDLGNTKQEYTTPLSNKHNLYTRGKAQQQLPLHLKGQALSQTTITSHQRDKDQSQHHHNHLYTQRDTTTTSTITSHQRDTNKYKEGYNTWWYQQPQTNFLTNFLTKLDPNRQDRQIAQV